MRREEQKTEEEVIPEELKQRIALSVDEELFWCAANLLQAEEHLLQTLYEAPTPLIAEIGELIAAIRSTRVQIMKQLGISNPAGQVWCASKHLISAAYRLMEASEKSITQLHSPRLAKQYSSMARRLLELLLIGCRELIAELKAGKEGGEK